MDDQPHVFGVGVMLRRPVVDPGIPRPDRALLAAPGTVLTPAYQDRPARHRDFLPADPGRRGATIDGAVMGLVAAGFVAVGGTVPLAIGVLVFQGPVAWQSASSHYALLLAELIVVVTALIFCARIALFGQPSGKAPADAAARAYHGRYLTAADFDARARALLRRTQDAVDAVTSSKVYRDGLLDEPAVSVALAEQEWDIALALREQARLRAEQARLRAERAELSRIRPGTVTAALLDRQAQAARVAEDSVANRVVALERYVAEVRDADAAYRDWQQAAALAELNGRHLDMLARTAADEHGVAELEAMSARARAIRLVLRAPRD
jgi:hypothetical protein